MTNTSGLELNTIKNLSPKDKTDSLAEIIKFFPNAIVSRPGELSDSIEKLLLQELIIHTVRLHLVLKIENKNHRIPFPRKIIKTLEKDGNYLHKIFNLCIAIHGRQPFLECEISYKNPFDWFYAINLELIRAAEQDILNLSEFEKPVHNGDKKRDKIRSFNTYISELKRLDNKRFSKEDLNNPYILLLWTGIELAEKSDDFKTNYWEPLITSMRELSKDTDSSAMWQRIFLINGVIMRQNKGRSKTFF